MMLVDPSLLLTKAGELALAALPLLTLYVRKQVAFYQAKKADEAPKLPPIIVSLPSGNQPFLTWKWIRDRSEIPYDRLILLKDGSIKIEFRKDEEARREAFINDD